MAEDANGQELERLIVRLVGDADSYESMLREAGGALESFSDKSGQLLEAHGEQTKRLVATTEEHNQVVEESVAITKEVISATGDYTHKASELNAIVEEEVSSQKALTQAFDGSKDAMSEAQDASKDLVKANESVGDSSQSTSADINDTGTVMGAFAIKVDRGVGRSLGNLGRTASQAGLAVQMVNPALGQTITTFGLLTASVGQAAATIYKSQTAFTGLVKLALNPFTLVAVPLAVAGLVLWKRHSDAVKAAQEALELSTKRVSKAAQEYGEFLQIFGKVPGLPKEEGDVQQVEAAAKAQYKTKNLAFQEAQKELEIMQKEEAKRRRQWEIDNPLVNPTKIGKAHWESRMQKAGEASKKVMDELAGKIGATSEASRRAQEEWEKTKGPAEAEKEQVKINKLMEEFIASKQEEIDLSSLATEREVANLKEINKLRRDGFNERQIAQAEIMQAEADAAADEKQRGKDLEKEAAKQMDNWVDVYDKQLEEGKRVAESVMTPAEKLAKEQEKLQDLLEIEAITPEEYARALKKAREEAAKIDKHIQSAAAAMSTFAGVAAGSAAHMAMLGVNPLGGPTEPGSQGTGKASKMSGFTTEAERNANKHMLSSFSYMGPTTSMEGPLERGPFSLQGETSSITGESRVQDWAQGINKLVVIAEKYWGKGTNLTIEPAGLK